MSRRSLLSTLSGLLLYSLSSVALAQDSVSMNAPVIKSTDDEVVLMATFTGFDRSKDYRIAVGVEKGSMNGFELDVRKNGEAIQLPPTSFTQGFTASWWGVPELKSTGFAVTADNISGMEDRITLRIKVAKSSANELGKIYVFASRKYGPQAWYLADGSYAEQADW